MNILDFNAKETVLKLQKKFNVNIKEEESIFCPYTVGAEIEVKFRYFFPDIFEKYFNGDILFRDRSENEQHLIDKEISIQEEPILKKLNSTIECGIPRGYDRYWEFSFNPVNDFKWLYYQIEILRSINLIPKTGQHSLHLTIGTKLSKEMFYVLFGMELLFLNKERIESEFIKEYGAWSKKGRGGIYEKDHKDLTLDQNGFEFRTMMIYPDSDIYKMFQTLNYLLTNKVVLDDLKNEMLKFGLADENWENPREKSEIWKSYVNNFDKLSNWLKNVIK